MEMIIRALQCDECGEQTVAASPVDLNDIPRDTWDAIVAGDLEHDVRLDDGWVEVLSDSPDLWIERRHYCPDCYESP